LKNKKILSNFYLSSCHNDWGISSVGRALAWHVKGHRFESDILHIFCIHHHLYYMQENNPLHGKTLKAIVEELVKHFGWEQLGLIININCFTINPSINSTLKFLRKTEWARKKVEQLYVDAIC
jgi:DNA-binding protein VF530